MNLSPSGEQAMVRDLVRRFLSDRYDATNIAKGPMAPDDWRALGDLGLFALLLPEAAGGMGGGPVEVMIVAEELGRALAITPLAESVVLCGHLIAGSAIATPQAEAMASGEAVLAFARGGLSRDGLLSGDCGLVRDGMAVSAFVIVPDDGAALLVDAAAPGVVRSPVRMVDGSVAAQLRFDSAQAQELAGAGSHLPAAMALAELAIVAELVGAMGTILDLTVDYVRQRRQFGKPIGSFQVIQHRCARLYASLEQSRSMLLKAALAEGEAQPAAVTAAKAYVCDSALRLAEDAVQLHGGMGVTEELAIGRGLRRVLLLSRLFGGGIAARVALAA